MNKRSQVKGTARLVPGPNLGPAATNRDLWNTLVAIFALTVEVMITTNCHIICY